MEPPPSRPNPGRVWLVAWLVSACADPAAPRVMPLDTEGVEGDSSALSAPPQWPEGVHWSPSNANQGRFAIDADDDGIIDLLLLGRGPDIAFLARGRGDGRFETPRPVHSDRLGRVEGGAAVADVNHDGLSDLVYLSALSNNDAPRRARVTTLLGRRDGSFEARVSDFDGYAGPLLALDADGDRQTDLVIAFSGSNQDPRFGTYLLSLRGQGDGTFAASERAPGRVEGLTPTQLLQASIQGKAAPSLIVVGHDAKGRAAFVVRNQTSDEGGDDSAIVRLSDGAAEVTAQVADLDLDRRDELVFFDATERTLTSVQFSHGARSVLVSQNVPGDLYALASDFAVADLNHDGLLDLVLPGSATRSTEGFRFGPVLIVSLGDGAGHFDPHRVLQLAAKDGEFGAQALTADVDADGELDLLLGTYGTESDSGRTAVLCGPLTE